MLLRFLSGLEGGGGGGRLRFVAKQIDSRSGAEVDGKEDRRPRGGRSSRNYCHHQRRGAATSPRPLGPDPTNQAQSHPAEFVAFTPEFVPALT